MKGGGGGPLQNVFTFPFFSFSASALVVAPDHAKLTLYAAAPAETKSI